MTDGRGMTVHPRAKYVIYCLDTDEFYKSNSAKELNEQLTALVDDLMISAEDAFDQFLRVYDVETDRQLAREDFSVELKLDTR